MLFDAVRLLASDVLISIEAQHDTQLHATDAAEALNEVGVPRSQRGNNTSWGTEHNSALTLRDSCLKGHQTAQDRGPQ